MTDADFRMLLLIIAAIFLPIGIYYRLRAHTGEKLDRWQEGPLILVGLRLTAAALFAAFLIWLINPQQLAWSSRCLS